MCSAHPPAHGTSRGTQPTSEPSRVPQRGKGGRKLVSETRCNDSPDSTGGPRARARPALGAHPFLLETESQQNQLNGARGNLQPTAANTTTPTRVRARCVHEGACPHTFTWKSTARRPGDPHQRHHLMSQGHAGAAPGSSCHSNCTGELQSSVLVHFHKNKINTQTKQRRVCCFKTNFSVF